MARVALRIYTQEIEALIGQGHTDEAIAHCRHILKTFPKHLETYRLLGKAYLEARRYNESIDILGRLLMAVPDDFSAHVCLSIIRDEENKLDDAIWHMERAFEVQPSNSAVQGELQRLYGKRDGMQPPKIRMTRGALARIYMQGELYPQSIAEIRGVLAEDPQRADMQVLLANAYFKSGQNSDATDLCNQLLKRYPYAFDANRIMVDLLPTTTGALESTQVYRMRVGEMDPYSNFSTGSTFDTSNAPDASINLEKLEYHGEEVQLENNWGSALGIELTSTAVPAMTSSLVSDQPDWLKEVGIGTDIENQTPQDKLTADSEIQQNDEIPDFLRAAGWGESTGPEQPTSIFDEDPTENTNLVAADLPDWLKGQAPSNEPDTMSSQTENFQEPVTNGELETTDWLSQISNSDSLESAQEESIPASADENDIPDWLSGVGGELEMSNSNQNDDDTLQPTNLPDWLKQAEPKQEASSSAIENLGTSSQEQDDAVAWLESLAAKHGAKPEELVTDPNKRNETPPDWVAQAQNIGNQPQQTTTTNVENLGTSSQEQDDAVAWLESLASKHGAKPEELVTDPNKRNETPPDWVAQAQNIGNQPQQPESTNVENLGASSQEQDDAVAWLESLAAKHGAKPEELVTDPNKRSETPPDWVSQAQNIGNQPSAQEPAIIEPVDNALNVGEQFFAEFEKSSAEEAKGEQTDAWLNDLETKASENEVKEIPEWLSETAQSSTSQETSDLPNWLNDIDENKPADSEQLLGSSNLSDWLSGLDDEPGLDIDPEILRASQHAPSQNQPVAETAKKDDVPDWLSDVSETEEQETDDEWTPPEVKTVSDSATSLPDWLSDVDGDKSAEADDLPPWLHREQYETTEAESADVKPVDAIPTAASDWQPAQSKTSLTGKLSQTPPPPQPTLQTTAKAEKKKVVSTQKPPKQKKVEGETNTSMLHQAKAELDRGDIPEALLHYGKLIKRGKNLEEIIRDLSESLYRYPVEVNIWQALGDAYMRANRLKEALDAYNKAEELIR